MIINAQNCFVLVCDGAELKAVKKVLKNSVLEKNIIGLPMGLKPVKQVLESQKLSQKFVILVGLGGSLCAEYKVGDVVIYDHCIYVDKEGKIKTKYCDVNFNNYLINKLNIPLVKGLTVNNLIHSSSEKTRLNKLTDAEVIDMESYEVMSYFKNVCIIRVISDNYHDNLPNLNSAITSEGKLNNLKMMIAFMKEPLKALKLIKNALISLKILKNIIKQLIINN